MKDSGAVTKEKGIVNATRSSGGGAVAMEGRSFKEALVVRPVGGSSADGGGGKVVWEVEVETEALAKLKGAYVGFLADQREAHLIQRDFLLDGYKNIERCSH
jgi:hypothetical protein